MRDSELRAALENNGTAFEPAFRVRVLARICERARQRAMAQRAAVWIAAGIGVGFAAQTLTPPASGMPEVETIAMIASTGTTALMLAALMATRAGGAAQWLQRTLLKPPRS